MRRVKTNEELKREYYSRPKMYFTPMMIDSLVVEYGDKPATTGEAIFVAHERALDLVSQLPIVGRLVR